MASECLASTLTFLHLLSKVNVLQATEDRSDPSKISGAIYENSLLPVFLKIRPKQI